MVIVVFVATCVRYLTVMSLPWAEEVARYSMVWIAYVGASLGIKRNSHLGVEAVLLLLPKVLHNGRGRSAVNRATPRTSRSSISALMATPERAVRSLRLQGPRRRR